jgi:hypothetical protein
VVDTAGTHNGYSERRGGEQRIRDPSAQREPSTDKTSREKEPMSTKRAEVKHYHIIDTSTLDNRVQSPLDAVMNRRRPCATIRLGSYDGSSVPLHGNPHIEI